MEGKKAYILPVVAALVLLAWWIFGPKSEGEPQGAGSGESLEAVIDREIGGAVRACTDATPGAEVTSVTAIVSGPIDGRAAVEQLAFQPAELPPELRSCLLALVGKELSAPGPGKTVRYTTSPAS